MLERAEKVKRQIESLGGYVGKGLMADDGEEEIIRQRGSTINGTSTRLWSDPDLGEFESSTDWAESVHDSQPDVPALASGSKVDWHGMASVSWDSKPREKECWVVRQGPGADCSVVAGLSVCLEHNRRWGMRVSRRTGLLMKGKADYERS